MSKVSVKIEVTPAEFDLIRQSLEQTLEITDATAQDDADKSIEAIRTRREARQQGDVLTRLLSNFR